MTKTIEDLFVVLANLSDFLIICFFLSVLRRAKASMALPFIAANSFFAILVSFGIDYSEISSKLLYTLFTFFEYSFFSAILYVFISNKAFKKSILFLSFIFLVFIFFYFQFAKFRSIDSIPIGIETIFIIIFSFYFLYEQMNNLEHEFVYNRFEFWIVIGMMIYLAGSFFIYVFANQVDRKTLDQYWFLTNVFYIIKNILFAVGILTYVKRAKNPHPERLYPYLN